jgi:uncharacterized damage-inducible protein DinB
MIDVAYVRLMARYNRWQNESLYGAADGLSDDERQRECGAFFGSIQGTLSHLMWADRIWMSRFSDLPKPGGSIKESPSLYPDWATLKRERRAFDEAILDWAERLDPAWLAGDLTWYSGAAKAERTKPKALLVVHLFNHQAHHRGQVHCMLTQAGATPDDTDLVALKP